MPTPPRRRRPGSSPVHRRPWIATALTAAALVALGSPLRAQRPDPGPLADARRGIDQGNAGYIAGFARADAHAVAAVYDADGARLNDDGAVVRGRSAIAADVQHLLDQVGPVTVKIGTGQVWLVDDMAPETGTWSYTYTPRGKAQQTIGGHYVTVWRRQADGGWQIYRDMGVPGTG